MKNFVLDTYGKDQDLGFNINCLFDKMVKASKLLTEEAAHVGLQVIVNAFYGWAHN